MSTLSLWYVRSIFSDVTAPFRRQCCIRLAQESFRLLWGQREGVAGVMSVACYW